MFEMTRVGLLDKIEVENILEDAEEAVDKSAELFITQGV